MLTKILQHEYLITTLALEKCFQAFHTVVSYNFNLFSLDAEHLLLSAATAFSTLLNYQEYTRNARLRIFGYFDELGVHTMRVMKSSKEKVRYINHNICIAIDRFSSIQGSTAYVLLNDAAGYDVLRHAFLVDNLFLSVSQGTVLEGLMTTIMTSKFPSHDPKLSADPTHNTTAAAKVVQQLLVVRLLVVISGSTSGNVVFLLRHNLERRAPRYANDGEHGFKSRNGTMHEKRALGHSWSGTRRSTLHSDKITIFCNLSDAPYATTVSCPGDVKREVLCMGNEEKTVLYRCRDTHTTGEVPSALSCSVQGAGVLDGSVQCEFVDNGSDGDSFCRCSGRADQIPWKAVDWNSKYSSVFSASIEVVVSRILEARIPSRILTTRIRSSEDIDTQTNGKKERISDEWLVFSVIISVAISIITFWRLSQVEILNKPLPVRAGTDTFAQVLTILPRDIDWISFSALNSYYNELIFKINDAMRVSTSVTLLGTYVMISVLNACCVWHACSAMIASLASSLYAQDEVSLPRDIAYQRLQLIVILAFPCCSLLNVFGEYLISGCISCLNAFSISASRELVDTVACSLGNGCHNLVGEPLTQNKLSEQGLKSVKNLRVQTCMDREVDSVTDIETPLARAKRSDSSPSLSPSPHQQSQKQKFSHCCVTERLISPTTEVDSSSRSDTSQPNLITSPRAEPITRKNLAHEDIPGDLASEADAVTTLHDEQERQQFQQPETCWCYFELFTGFGVSIFHSLKYCLCRLPSLRHFGCYVAAPLVLSCISFVSIYWLMSYTLYPSAHIWLRSLNRIFIITLVYYMALKPMAYFIREYIYQTHIGLTIVSLYTSDCTPLIKTNKHVEEESDQWETANISYLNYILLCNPIRTFMRAVIKSNIKWILSLQLASPLTGVILLRFLTCSILIVVRDTPGLLECLLGLISSLAYYFILNPILHTDIILIIVIISILFVVLYGVYMWTSTLWLPLCMSQSQVQGDMAYSSTITPIAEEDCEGNLADVICIRTAIQTLGREGETDTLGGHVGIRTPSLPDFQSLPKSPLQSQSQSPSQSQSTSLPTTETDHLPNINVNTTLLLGELTYASACSSFSVSSTIGESEANETFTSFLGEVCQEYVESTIYSQSQSTQSGDSVYDLDDYGSDSKVLSNSDPISSEVTGQE